MIGTAVKQVGAVTRGHVELGSYPDGPVYSPVMVAAGMKPGPRLYVQACVHGPEVVGPLAIHAFLKQLDLNELSGTIVFLMLANPLGFRGYNRLTPQDGLNLNRVFPGKIDGTVTEQLAYRLMGIAQDVGDALLDLHSGGDLSITPNYAIFHNDGSEAGQASERLARSTGAPNIWDSHEESLSGAQFANLTKRGMPAIIVESGGGSRVLPHDIERLKGAIIGVCQAMKMLPGDPPKVERYKKGKNGFYLKSRTGGFFIPYVSAGDDVVKGQHLADIVDIYGDVVEELRCPLDVAWIGSVRRPHMPLYGGDQVFEIVGLGGFDPA